MTVLTLCVQLAIALAVGAGLIAACRWLRRRSPLCAHLVVAGLLLRAAVTLFLFWTSYLDLPILRHLHSGDGFWKLAIDGWGYYDLALDAIQNGLGTISSGSASPTFIRTLALWMLAVGSSPISGAYLNLTLYVLLCVMIVAAFRPSGQRQTDLPCIVMLSAVSFSPALVAFSSQPLKDPMFLVLIGVTCVAAQAFLPSLTVKGRPGAGALGMGAAFLPALFVFGGIRAYYAVLSWTALALVLFVFAWRQNRAQLVRYASVCLLLLVSAWLSYMAGAGLDYLNPYATAVNKAWALTGRAAPAVTRPETTPETAQAPVEIIDRYRAGFVQTPGATNIGSSSSAPSISASSNSLASPVSVENTVLTPVTPEQLHLGSGGGVRGRLSAAAVGLGLIFVPVSVLKALSLVDFQGGRGLLAIADADTLFMDLTIVMVIALLIRHRSALLDRLAYVGFVAILAAASAVLMAYIVTNFGTLFRLRLIVAAPLWMLPLVLSRRSEGSEPPADSDARLAARTQASFGYEWTHFHRWQDSGDVNFRDYFGTADLAALRGARVLDAGCGMGRHAREMAAHARHVVAVDFSHAIEQAATNTRGAGRVDCVRADLLRLPFPDATFDYVYSLGVLHHLGNTETAVRALVAQLKPGGRLRVYLYWKRHGGVGAILRVVNAARPVTTRLPFWLLRWLCGILSAALWLTVILPYRLLAWAGVRGSATWPLFVYTKHPFRILYNDQFDRFSAPLEKRYDPEEVSALLESAGLRDVKVEARFGWVAEGVKPMGQDPCAE